MEKSVIEKYRMNSKMKYSPRGINIHNTIQFVIIKLIKKENIDSLTVCHTNVPL